MITRGGGAGTNPFQIFENATSNGGGVILPGNNNTSGLTPLASPGLVSGQRTLFLLPIGDSFESNSCAVAYTPTNSTVHMLNVYSGLLYPYSDPWLGPSTGPGSYIGQLADAIINSGKFARVICGGGCAMGGATSKDFSPWGSFAHRLGAMMLYARQKGYPLSAPGDGGNWQMAVPIMFGTNDNAQGYSALQYTTYTMGIVNLLRAYGCNAKVFIPQFKTLLNGSISTGLQGAQAAILSNALGIYAWSNYDQYTGPTYRVADGTHPTPAMTAAISSNGAAIIQASY
jgi:hypothetical protein